MKQLVLILVGLCLVLGSTSRQALAEPSGEALYLANCGHCHDRKLPRMPTRLELTKIDPSDVFVTLTAGLMAAYTPHLSYGERRAIAEYVTGKPLGDFSSTANLISKESYCKTTPAPMSKHSTLEGWNGWGINVSNTRFQNASNAGLSKEDVSRLKVKWAFGVPAVTTMSGQPTVIGNRLFFGTFSGLVISLDAESGCVHWVYEAKAGVRTAIVVAHTYASTPSVYFGDLTGSVYSVNANTGALRWRKSVEDHPHVRITGSPVHYQDRLYVPVASLEEVAGAMPDYECCTFRGSIVALDDRSGEIIWKTYTISEIPSKRKINKLGTQLYGPAGAAIWSAPTLDPENNVLYVTTGDNYSDPASPESDAVMALSMQNGDVAWIRQTTAGDAFNLGCHGETEDERIGCPDADGPDVDYGASAVLRTLPDGQRILLAGQKSGMIYGMDPDSGEIRWETRVSQGGIVGGIEWGFSVDNENAYIALSDAWEKGPGKAGGISAVNIKNGEKIWEVGPPADTCEGDQRCNTGQLAAVSGMPGVVFSGCLDGHLRAYSTEDGSILWDFDTMRDFETVNGVPARGGSLNGPGPTIFNGVVYANSGYGLWHWVPGNVLLAFSVDGK